MAIKHVVTRGFGNGSFDTNIKKRTLSGYGNGYVTGTIGGQLDSFTGKMRQSAATAAIGGGILLALGLGIGFLM